MFNIEAFFVKKQNQNAFSIDSYVVVLKIF